MIRGIHNQVNPAMKTKSTPRGRPWVGNCTGMLAGMLMVSRVLGFAGGDGSPGSPYQVAARAHLDALRDHLAAHFVQTGHITLHFPASGPATGSFNGPHLKSKFLAAIFLAVVLLQGLWPCAAHAAPGAVEAGFVPQPDGFVRTTAVQPDGHLLVGGEFSNIGGMEMRRLARLSADGTPDAAFSPPDFFGEAVNAVAVLADGKILVGGSFATTQGETVRLNLVRLNANGTLDAGFNPGADAVVSALAIQDDGKILVAGDFNQIGGGAWSRFARLNADGTIDSGFMATQIDASVDCIALQPDGKILIGGNFTTVSTVARNRIARLGADGFPDADFNPGADDMVEALAVQPDGSILVGGNFSIIGGEARAHLARLLADGTVDAGFSTVADGSVSVLALQADGGILAGGWFGTIGGQSRGYVARLLADGALDGSFNPGADLPILALALQSDGRVVVAGVFSTIGGQSRTGLARLENGAATGWLEVFGRERVAWQRGGCAPEVARVTFDSSGDGGETWTPLGMGMRVSGGWELTDLQLLGSGLVRARGFVQDGSLFNGCGIMEAAAEFPVYTVTFALDGKGTHTSGGDLIQRVTGGEAATAPVVQANPGWSFTGWDGVFDSITADHTVTALYEALPVPRGDADLTFDPDANGPVYSVTIQADGGIIVAGVFTSIGGQARGRIARFHADGTLDEDFNPGATGPVYAVALQADGKIVVGGSFVSIGGHSRSNIARLNPDGTVDPDFHPGASSTVLSLAVQTDGKILLGGVFTGVGAYTRNHIARVSASGAVDFFFNPNSSGHVYSILLQPDGGILVCGVFTRIGGQMRNSIARLDSSGTADGSFNPNPNDAVLSLGLQADGKILVGGAFTELGGQPRQRIARLHASGSVDADFTPIVFGGLVYALTLQVDGKILLGETFTHVVGAPRSRIARLGADGLLDPDFVPQANNNVYALALQADGRVLAGGSFNFIGGQARDGLARLGNDPANEQLMVTEGTRADWLREGSSPELGRVSFDLSGDDGGTWWPLGAGTRGADGWEITGLVLAGTGEIRARGFIHDGSYSSGSGIVESIMTFDAGGEGYHRVIFAIGNKGTRIGGGVLAQMVAPGGAAVAPEVAANDGWVFNGWDVDFAAITEDLTVTAQYAAHGAVDIGFAATANGTVYATAVQPDGRILVAGNFTTLGGQTRNRIARLHPDGTLDESFNPNANGTVFAVAVQPDGKIIIGGGFTGVAAAGRSCLARLHADGTLDSAFNMPVSGGQVYALALQHDGMILLGGAFTSVGGQSRSGLARLRSDGTLDTGFTTGTNNTVGCITLQVDGKILIGGRFTQVGFYGRGRVARLLVNGSVDTGFNPSAGGYSDSAVHSIAVQADGNILLGGSFTSVGGITRPYLARVTAAGVLDGSFYPALNGQVFALALQADGTILIGGDFTALSGLSTWKLARLTAAGERDAGFLPNPNNTVFGIGLQADGRILVGGAFSSIGGGTRAGLARLWNAPATANLTAVTPNHARWLRSGSSPEVGRAAFELSVDDGANWHAAGDGERTAGGWQINNLRLAGSGRLRVRGFIRDGSVYSGSGIVGNETDFDFGGLAHLVKFEAGVQGVLTSNVSPAQLIADGGAAEAPAVQALAGWVFSGWDTVFGNVTDDLTVTARYAVAPGYPAPDFNPNVSGSVLTMALRADGKILVGGGFSGVGGQGRPYLARLHPDGTLDSSFDPGSINDQIYTMALQPDGRILVGGSFSGIGGQGRNRIARLNPDGSLDTGFNPNANNNVRAMVLQPDGKILVGGDFTGIAGGSRNRIARLNPDGTLDTGFNPNANNSICSLALQPDGKIVAGGNFTSIAGQTRYRIARLHPDGSLDTSFNSRANNTVYSLAVQPDGRIVMGGAFTDVGGSPRYRIARLSPGGTVDGSFAFLPFNNTVYALVLQTDGSIFIGGDFTLIGSTTCNRIARLGSNGALDGSYAPSPGATVYSLVLQSDGSLLAGGAFTTLSGQTRNRIGRIVNHAATNRLTVGSAERVEWLRGGTSPEAGRVTIESSPDGNDPWTLLGAGTRVDGGWELTGLDLEGSLWIRARAHADNGSSYSGSGLHEAVVEVVFHSVVFDLAGKGNRSGGGTLVQAVLPGQSAIAPEVAAGTGWEFVEWDGSFDVVNEDTTVTARFQAVDGSFYAWMDAQGLNGDPVECFHETDPLHGIPRGAVYAFGGSLTAGVSTVRVIRVGGNLVIEVLPQDEATLPYVSVRLAGSLNFADDSWTLPLKPAVETTGKPADSDWFEVDGPAPSAAYFRLEFTLK